MPSDHRGVFIIEPIGRHGFRARFRDPDLDKQLKRTLPVTDLPHVKLPSCTPQLAKRLQSDSKTGRKARRDYCVRLKEALEHRKRQLEEGAARTTNLPLEDALERFLEPKPHPDTQSAIRAAVRIFIGWAGEKRIQTVGQVRRGTLKDFRDYLLGTVMVERDWSPKTFNTHLGHIKSFIRYAIDAELGTGVTYNDLPRIRPIKAAGKKREWLSPNQVRRVLEAALRYDRDSYETTRWTPGEGRVPRLKHAKPIAPYALYVLLSQCRAKEARENIWENVDLDFEDVSGNRVGKIVIPASISKMKRRREIGLRETPGLLRLLKALKLQSRGRKRIFDLSATEARNAMRKMRTDYGAPPEFCWQVLRVTAECYLVNAPSIYGGSAASMASKRAGHSVLVAEEHYTDQIHGIDPAATTLEQALRIEDLCEQIIRSVASPDDRASVSRIAAST